MDQSCTLSITASDVQPSAVIDRKPEHGDDRVGFGYWHTTVLGPLALVRAWAQRIVTECDRLEAVRSAQEELDLGLVVATRETVAHQLLGVDLLDEDAAALGYTPDEAA